MIEAQAAISEVFILVATAFDERFVVDCLATMRDEGVAVKLVGLGSGFIKSVRGLQVCPDMTLLQLEQQPFVPWKRPLLVLPGNAVCIAHLLSDPRVHRLVRTAVAANGCVATATAAQSLFYDELSLLDKRKTAVLPQGQQANHAFIEQLVVHLQR